MKRKWPTLLLISVTLPGLLQRNSVGFQQQLSTMPADRNGNERTFAMKLASNQASGYFQSSMDTEENVDFMLVPAFIMQESLSPDCVPTYSPR
jgi:hypothetical protein